MMTPRDATASTSPQQMALSAAWRLALMLLTSVLVLWLLIFHESLWSMVEIWSRSDTFGHGFLIAPIVVYLIWQRRAVLVRQSPSPALWALVAVAGSVLLWFVARVTGVLAVEEFAALFVLQAAVLTVLGWRICLTLIFPLGYLLLMVPFGEFLVNPLQDITVFFVVNALQLIGIPVFSDGIFLQIPNGNFTVAEACAGLRFLVATLALGLLFANAAYQDWWRRSLFMVLVLVVPVIANGFRALGIVLLAHYTDNQVAVEADHVIYGWVFLTFVTLVLLGIGMALRAKTVPPERQTVVSLHAPRPIPLLVSAAAVIVLMAAAPALSAWLRPAADAVGTVRLAAPAPSSPWRQIDAVDWQPAFQGAAGEVLARFSDGADEVDLYLAYYPHQAQDAEVVNPNNKIAPEPDWLRAADQTVTMVVDGETLAVTATRIVDADRRQRARVVLRWYWVGGRMVGSQANAKLLQLWGLVSGQPAAAALVVATDDPGAAGVALETLQGFIGSLPPLDAFLEQAGFDQEGGS
jgi:exosortase A